MALIYLEDHYNAKMPFEMQVIMNANSRTVVGHEMLYRGPAKPSWRTVDNLLLRHVQARTIGRQPLFINLCNETILTENLVDYVPTWHRDNVFFELTETFTDSGKYFEVAERVNAFAREGIKFALDDFGSGLDGLHRHAALTQIAFVKLDRTLLQQALQNSITERMLRVLVEEWRRSSTRVIAEGIETTEDLALCQRIGVGMLQGFYIDALFETTNGEEESAGLPMFVAQPAV